MKSEAWLGIFICTTVSLAVASSFKSVVITNSTLTINLPGHHFLQIYNFTQEGGMERGLVVASASTATPAPTATSTATPTPTPTPSGTATPTATPTPTPTPTPPPRAVLTATLIDPGTSPPEFIRPVTIAGPATVTVAPVPGGKLFITYRKFSEPTPTPTP
jgi:hypothetical protein